MMQGNEKIFQVFQRMDLACKKILTVPVVAPQCSGVGVMQNQRAGQVEYCLATSQASHQLGQSAPGRLQAAGQDSGYCTWAACCVAYSTEEASFSLCGKH